ncbi:MAG: hypothetical protein WC648_04165 [Candidatus Paceibacterota bacterium]|jgi:hypothetical protein
MKTLSEILHINLVDIENALWSHQADKKGMINFTQASFRAACKIFLTVMTEKIFEKQDKTNMPLEERLKEGENFGDELRQLILKYTFVDTKKLY